MNKAEGLCKSVKVQHIMSIDKKTLEKRKRNCVNEGALKEALLESVKWAKNACCCCQSVNVTKINA